MLNRREIIAGTAAMALVPATAAAASPEIDMKALRALLHEMKNPDKSKILADTYDYVMPLAARLEEIIGSEA